SCSSTFDQVNDGIILNRHRHPAGAVAQTGGIILPDRRLRYGQPVLRESRVMRYHILEIEPLELSVGKMQPHLFAQLQLRAHATPVADDKHSDQQFRINRRATNVAVEPTQLFVEIAECRRRENINPAQKGILWHHVIEPELVEQARLLSMLSPHHAESSCAHT